MTAAADVMPRVADVSCVSLSATAATASVLRPNGSAGTARCSGETADFGTVFASPSHPSLAPSRLDAATPELQVGHATDPPEHVARLPLGPGT